MPRIVIITCDRCDAEVSRDRQVYRVVGGGRELVERHVYLCDPCAKEWREWMARKSTEADPCPSNGPARLTPAGTSLDAPGGPWCDCDRG
jgi:hypothetical protein